MQCRQYEVIGHRLYVYICVLEYYQDLLQPPITSVIGGLDIISNLLKLAILHSASRFP